MLANIIVEPLSVNTLYFPNAITSACIRNRSRLMSSQRKILNSSPIGLVPLNWSYTPSKMTEYLSSISNYGFEGIQISSDQALSSDFLAEMTRNKIRPAEQYVAIRCDLAGPLLQAEEESRTTVEAAEKAGVEMLVFAVDGSDDREQQAGRAESAVKLTDEGMKSLAEHIERYAHLAKFLGMKSSFHQHAATYIETPAETRSLLNLMDAQLVGVCLDVGHWLVGGGDPIEAVFEYAERITHVHVKDVNGQVLQDLIDGKYETMNDAVILDKLFVPAGSGILNLLELFESLEKINFSGWLMSEQDSAYEPSEQASLVSIKNIRSALI